MNDNERLYIGEKKAMKLYGLKREDMEKAYESGLLTKTTGVIIGTAYTKLLIEEVIQYAREIGAVSLENDVGFQWRLTRRTLKKKRNELYELREQIRYLEEQEEQLAELVKKQPKKQRKSRSTAAQTPN